MSWKLKGKVVRIMDAFVKEAAGVESTDDHTFEGLSKCAKKTRDIINSTEPTCKRRPISSRNVIDWFKDRSRVLTNSVDPEMEHKMGK